MDRSSSIRNYKIGLKKNQEYFKYIPNLFDFHKRSFDKWTQLHISPEKRENIGLECAFRTFFPIISKKSPIEISYLRYEFCEAENAPEECKLKGINYCSLLKVWLRLTDKNTGDTRDIVVSGGYLPIMIDNSFIINGHERIFICQIYRCPGAIFTIEKDPATGGSIFMGKMYSYRGLWLHFSIKKDGKMYVNIDKKKDISVTTLLMCFPKIYNNRDNSSVSPGYSFEEILKMFYSDVEILLEGEEWKIPFNKSKHKYTNLPFNVYEEGEIKLKKGERASWSKLSECGEYILIPKEEILGSYLFQDFFNEETGEIYGEAGDKIDQNLLKIILGSNIKKLKICSINDDSPEVILKTWNDDKVNFREQALFKWGEAIKISSHYGIESLAMSFDVRFFDQKFYTLESFGRERLNKTLNLDKTEYHLTIEDLVAISKKLVNLSIKRIEADDIDSLINRRLKRIEDALDTAFRNGMKNFVNNTLNRIQSLDGVDSQNFSDVVNLKVAMSPINEMFNTGSLSQLVDDKNHFSRLVHYRKVTLVSPGGLGSKEGGISIQLRLVNISEYGRICPVQSTEGPNIGLVRHLSQFSVIDENGFICSPFHPVYNGIANSELELLSPFDETSKVIASISDYERTEKNGETTFIPKTDNVLARKGDTIGYFPSEKIDYIDVSPSQIFSLSAGLIPFAERNDAYRVLTSSNINVQALHILEASPPIVATGLEEIVSDSLVAKTDSIIEKVNSSRIVAKRLSETEEEVVDVYDLASFEKTGHDTCRTQRPLVDVGQKIKKGGLLADGFTTKQGELSLGANLNIVYCFFPGTYEDAFILNKSCTLTSIGISVVEAVVVDTRHGQELITADVPGGNEDLLMKLDEYGIVRIGVHVNPGDIVLGKITPQSFVDKAPEQKLLSAIFGDRAEEYSNTSVLVPHGMSGIVTKVEILTKKGVEKDGRTLHQDKLEIDSLTKISDEKIEILVSFYTKKINEILSKNVLLENFQGFPKGKNFVLEKEDLISLKESPPVETKKAINILIKTFRKQIEKIEKKKKEKINSIKSGYDLPEGTLKVIRVYISSKQRIEPGDKLCGRHGNKGVISALWPESDMPYLADGTIADLVISPIGIMSRMNLGQIFETILAYALNKARLAIYDSLKLHKKGDMNTLEELKRNIRIGIQSDSLEDFGYKVLIRDASEKDILEVASYIVREGLRMIVTQFDSISNEKMKEYLIGLGLSESGKYDVYDGRTGEKFSNPLLFGIEYIYKLCHLVANKIHARSVGAYSYTNLQPLSGRARFGGQRIGEMEGWAFQSHGAACTLLDTILNSDSVSVRNTLYRALSSGRKWSNVLFPEVTKKQNALAESFWIFARELRSVGIKLEMENSDGKIVDFIGIKKPTAPSA